jgi:hypothetical protein
MSITPKRSFRVQKLIQIRYEPKLDLNQKFGLVTII